MDRFSEQAGKELLQAFKTGTTKRKVFGQFRILGDYLVYMPSDFIMNGHRDLMKENPNEFVEGAFFGNRIDVIAYKRPDGTVWGNTAQYRFVNRVLAWGQESYRSRGEAAIQRAMEVYDDIFRVPFSVFRQAQIPVHAVEMVHQAGAEKVPFRQETREYRDADYFKQERMRNDGTAYEIIQRHYTGAVLMKAGEKYLLFDLDRRELEHGVWNPFVCTTPEGTAPKTVQEAYELLKPKEVLQAEKKGLDVKRQGEWFFIPAKKPPETDIDMKKMSEVQKLAYMATGGGRRQQIHSAEAEQLENLYGAKVRKQVEKAVATLPVEPGRISLRAGNNRPNIVESGFRYGEKTYVTGSVEHSGREHLPLQLDDWHIAVCNTAIESVQITGDVD